jgi:5-methylcytosine-specific restriction endonuclease McrA
MAWKGYTEARKAKFGSDGKPGNTTSRGYGWDYQKKRKEVLSKSRRCHVCGKLGADTVDHVPNAQDPKAKLLPCHSKCNESRGVRQREAKRGK